MKAIETEYGGYRFRSRLEARWAIFFDACGVEWEYEPEGYVLSDGTAYLPDFLLHDIDGYVDGDLYVEVKGEMNERDEHKVNAFAKDLSKTGRTFTGAGRSFARLLVVGNLPKGEDDAEMYDHMQCASGPDEWKNNYRLYWIEEAKWFDVWPAIYPVVSADGGYQRQFLIGDINYLECGANKADHEATAGAYSIANKARFEHGETPARKDILRCAIDGLNQVKEEKAEHKAEHKELLHDHCIKDPIICGIHYDDEADARWAVFFEIAGIEYTYHPQGTGEDNPSTYPTFVININSGRDSGRIFVCVKKNLYMQEYNSEKFNYTLVRHDYFENENTESERIDIRREFCKYYVPPIDILSDTVYSMFEDAYELEVESNKYNEPIMNFETLDGDWYSAILGIGENGIAEFYGVNWCDKCKNKIDFHNTERAYDIAKNVRFATNMPDKRWLEKNKVGGIA